MARRFRIVVCRGPECGDRENSRVLYDAFRARIAALGLEGVELGWQSCFGRCSQAPNVMIREVLEPPDGRGQRFVFTPGPAHRGRTALYNRVDLRDVLELVDEHLLRGRPVRRLIRAPERARQGGGTQPADEGESPT